MMKIMFLRLLKPKVTIYKFLQNLNSTFFENFAYIRIYLFGQCLFSVECTKKIHAYS